MKLTVLDRYRTPAILVLGAAGLALGRLALLVAVDEKNLLITGHPVFWLLGLLALAAAAVALLPSPGPRGRSPRREALGVLAGGLGLAAAIPTIVWTAQQTLDGVHLGLAVVAALAMLLGAVLRWQGKSVPFLCYGAVCLFLAIHMICRYRVWSARPQLFHCLFPMLAALSMMVFSYLRCVSGRRQLRRTVALAGAFCCLCAGGFSGFEAMYFGGAAWLLAEQDAPGEVQ